MQLYIGNKNYSSWSLRPWLVMTQVGIAFDEVALRFGDKTADSDFHRAIDPINPAGKVPVLVDGDIVVWDTLAIVEYLAERFPDKKLWPADRKLRALARSVCAEMHSGFGALRTAFPMNIEATLHEDGRRELEAQPAVQANLQRIDALWRDALARSGGPFLFGEFGIADGYFAPVVSRLTTYGLPVSDAAADYMQRIQALSAMRAWTAAALVEHEWVADDEPYRQQPVG